MGRRDRIATLSHSYIPISIISPLPSFLVLLLLFPFVFCPFSAFSPPLSIFIASFKIRQKISIARCGLKRSTHLRISCFFFLFLFFYFSFFLFHFFSSPPFICFFLFLFYPNLTGVFYLLFHHLQLHILFIIPPTVDNHQNSRSLIFFILGLFNG